MFRNSCDPANRFIDIHYTTTLTLTQSSALAPTSLAPPHTHTVAPCVPLLPRAGGGCVDGRGVDGGVGLDLALSSKHGAMICIFRDGGGGGRESGKMYTQIHTHKYIHMRIQTTRRTHTHTPTHTHTHTHSRTHTQTHTHTHTSIQTHKHSNTHTHTQKNRNSNTYTHSNPHKQTNSNPHKQTNSN